MDRHSRTPKQHKMLIKRIRKIGRMFKPVGISFPEWFDKIRGRDVVDDEPDYK